MVTKGFALVLPLIKVEAVGGPFQLTRAPQRVSGSFPERSALIRAVECAGLVKSSRASNDDTAVSVIKLAIQQFEECLTERCLSTSQCEPLENRSIETSRST